MNKEDEYLKFQKNPNLIFKEIIVQGNSFRGCKFLGNLGYNDLFDIYYSYNEENKNKLFLVIKSISFDSNIDIINLENNEIIYQLKGGHQNNKTISMIRHFEDLKMKKNYLLSSSNKEVILWDLNIFKILHNLKSNYSQISYSNILLFNYYNKSFPNLIITSYSDENIRQGDFINVYNLETGKLIKNLKNSTSTTCFYLLYWNKYENNIYQNTYLIACCKNKIIIYNIYCDDKEKIIYGELKDQDNNNYNNYYNACLIKKKNKYNNNYDILCVSSEMGDIYLWELDSKHLKNIISFF